MFASGSSQVFDFFYAKNKIEILEHLKENTHIIFPHGIITINGNISKN